MNGARSSAIAAISAVVLIAIAASSSAAADDADEATAFEKLERVIEDFMAEHDIRAGTFAISVDRKIVHRSAHGFRDEAGEEPTRPGTRFRIASVAKPITAAVVRGLIADGELSLNTPAFDLLDIEPPEGAEPDARLERITVEHLLNHEGGWDRAKSGDPMFRDAAVQERLDLEDPPDEREIIRYMLSQPLDFDPGERSAYSNFGYCVLGRVVEAVTDKPFHEVVTERIAEPLAIDSFALGRTYAADRPADETTYPIADGDLHVERMDAHGGLIADAADLCRFMAGYWISGEPRPSDAVGEHGRSYAFFGGMPGTMSLIRQRPDGIDYAVLLNAFPYPHHTDIMGLLDDAIDDADVRTAATEGD